MTSSTSLARLALEDPWISPTTAAEYLGWSVTAVRKRRKGGYIRAYTGARVWVARDDVRYLLQQRTVHRKPRTLAERFSVPDIQGASGDDAFTWAMETQHVQLLLPLPEDPAIGVERRDSGHPAVLLRRVEALEGMVAELVAARVRTHRLPRLSPDKVKNLLRRVNDALGASFITRAQIVEWVGFMEAVDDALLSQVVAWAKSDPSTARELCGEGVTVLASLWRLASALRAHAASMDDGTPEATELRARAEAAHRHVEESCQTRILVERTLLTDGTKWAAVGLSPLDRRMVRALKRRAHSAK